MKRILVVFLILIIFSSLFACASKSESSVNDSAIMAKEARGDFSDEKFEETAFEEAVMEEQSAMEPEAEAFDGMNTDAINTQTDRKLIYYFNYNIETTDFDTDYDFILEKLESLAISILKLMLSPVSAHQFGLKLHTFIPNIG